MSDDHTQPASVFQPSYQFGETEFLFIRHAESTANVGSAATSVQVADPLLTEHGRQQAEALSKRLRYHDVKAIYASTTSRALLTVKPLSTKLGLTPTELPEIDEWNIGKGGQPDEMKLNNVFEKWCSGDTGARLEGAPYSETLDELNSRVVPTFRSLFDRHKYGGGVVIVVAHGGSISWTMPAFAKNVTLSYALQNYVENACSVSVTSQADQPYVSRWGEIAFSKSGPI